MGKQWMGLTPTGQPIIIYSDDRADDIEEKIWIKIKG